MADNRVSQFTFDEIEEKLGTIKYLNPSGLAHYDEKIKEVINGKDKLKGDTLYYDEEKSELQLKSGDNILSSVTIHDGLKIVTWADGTYDEIKAMLSAHYAGIIDISDYWSVGDVRTIPLSAMAATGVSEAHRAQTVEYAIIDFNKDDLETPINGNTKAAISVSQVHCLMDEANANSPTSGSSNTENGYMNSTNTNSGGWTSSARRTWCNDVYYNALPDTFKSMVKPVKKLTSAGAKSTTINTTVDKVFLLSEVEIYGTTKYSVAGEGCQYTYYETASNRYKNPKWSSSSNSCAYWQRSPYSDDSTRSCAVDNGGSTNITPVYTALGFAPCLCI